MRGVLTQDHLDARSQVYNLPQWPGWEQKFDPAGKLFYVDHSTRQTHWEHPAEQGPPPASAHTAANPRIFHRGGDWICRHCAGHNFASRTCCFTCQRPAAVAASMMVPHGRAAHPARGLGGAGNLKSGDWICAPCGGHNFASRNSCFTCNRANPAHNYSRSRSRSRRRSHSRSRSYSQRRCFHSRPAAVCSE